MHYEIVLSPFAKVFHPDCHRDAHIMPVQVKTADMDPDLVKDVPTDLMRARLVIPLRLVTAHSDEMIPMLAGSTLDDDAHFSVEVIERTSYGTDPKTKEEVFKDRSTWHRATHGPIKHPILGDVTVIVQPSFTIQDGELRFQADSNVGMCVWTPEPEHAPAPPDHDEADSE